MLKIESFLICVMPSLNVIDRYCISLKEFLRGGLLRHVNIDYILDNFDLERLSLMAFKFH